MAAYNIVMTANGNSTPISLPMKTENWTGLGASLLLNISGTATATVQVSNDPNANPTSNVSPGTVVRWNNHDVLVSRTASQNSSIVYPVAFVRLVVSGVSGNATIGLDIGIPDQL